MNLLTQPIFHKNRVVPLTSLEHTVRQTVSLLKCDLNARFLYAPGELEGGRRRATDSVRWQVGLEFSDDLFITITKVWMIQGKSAEVVMLSIVVHVFVYSFSLDFKQ